MEKSKIIIVHESVMQSLVKDAGTFGIAAGLIGLGVFLNSSAMQWFGFLVAAIIITGKALRDKSSEDGVSEFQSIEEARDFLDSMLK